ncbi:MAG: SAM-dependent chlorinase/fluorinase [Rhodospirillales bacterium]|nr:SAM-dependent chlorinase/fluorinase [Alphaproteobacteria bacterium]USO04190.1 MAG: SAM-dependent chlorinase/fluorinase [Rhodospirillales bacterium]
MSGILVSIIADYGALHDLAFAEVTQKLFYELDGLDFTIKDYSVPAFDTVATGFALAQTAMNSRLGGRHKFYVNTAPRKDNLAPRVKNAGEGLAYVKLYNGVEIVAVNSGYSLSFLKEGAEEMREINCAKEGSQFRSRDIFPPAFGKIAKGNKSELGADIRMAVPDYPKDVVCYTDGYGNIKTSVNPEKLEEFKGQDVTLEIGGRQQLVRAAEGIFGVADGQFCFAGGSSGWNLPGGTRLRFAEIVKRGGSAAETFGLPAGGMALSWRKLNP